MDRLSEADRTLLEFEEQQQRQLRQLRHGPRKLSEKEEAIRKTLGISPMRYYRRLGLLIDDPAANAEFPVLVHRLARIREQRADSSES